MKEIIFTIVILVIGVMISGAGIYYFLKEKKDTESRKIYGITTAVGLIICAAIIIKILLPGF